MYVVSAFRFPHLDDALARDFDRITASFTGPTAGRSSAPCATHDDDIDVCVPARHVPALLAAVARTAEYRVRDTKFCPKLERLGPEVWIDVFPVARDGHRVAYTNV